jgi:DNA-binding transcriptional ArsR family regulator
VKAANANHVFRALAEPTRRAIFEELTRQGEQTVDALTRYAGVSQPAVSKHLTVLSGQSWYGIAARDAKLTIARSPMRWRRWWTGCVTTVHPRTPTETVAWALCLYIP